MASRPNSAAAQTRRGSTGGGGGGEVPTPTSKSRVQRAKSISLKASTGKRTPKKPDSTKTTITKPGVTTSKGPTQKLSPQKSEMVRATPSKRITGKSGSAKATPNSKQITPVATPHKGTTPLVTPLKSVQTKATTVLKGSVSVGKPAIGRRHTLVSSTGSKTPGPKSLTAKNMKKKPVVALTSRSSSTKASVSKSQTARPPPNRISQKPAVSVRAPSNNNKTPKKVVGVSSSKKPGSKPTSSSSSSTKSKNSSSAVAGAKKKVSPNKKVKKVVKKRDSVLKRPQEELEEKEIGPNSETKTIIPLKRKSFLAEKLLMLQEQANLSKAVMVSTTETGFGNGQKRPVISFGLSPSLIKVCKGLGQPRDGKKRDPIGWMIVQEMEMDFHVFHHGPEVAQQGLDAIISKLTNDQVAYFFLNTAPEGPSVKAVLGVWVAQDAKEIFKARSQAGRDRLRDLTFEYFTTRAKFTVTDLADLSLKSIHNIMQGFSGVTSLKSDVSDREETAQKASQARDASARTVAVKTPTVRNVEEQEKLRQLMEQNKDSHIYLNEGSLYRIEFENRHTVTEALLEFQKSSSIGGSHFVIFSVEKFLGRGNITVESKEDVQLEAESLNFGNPEKGVALDSEKIPRDAAGKLSHGEGELSRTLEIERDQRVDEPETIQREASATLESDTLEGETQEEDEADQEMDYPKQLPSPSLSITVENPPQKTDESAFLSSTFEVIIPATPVKTPTGGESLIIPEPSSFIPDTPNTAEVAGSKLISPTPDTPYDSYNFVQLLSVGATSLTEEWKQNWLPEDGVRAFVFTFQTSSAGYGLKTYTMVVCWLGHKLKFHEAFKFKQTFPPLIDFIRRTLGSISGSMEVRSHEEVSLEILMDRVLGSKLRGVEQKLIKGAEKFKNANFGVKKTELVYEKRAQVVDMMRELSNEPDLLHPEKTVTWMLVGYKKNETSILQLQKHGYVRDGWLNHLPTVEDLKVHLKHDNICFLALRFFYIPDQFHDFPGDLYRYLKSQWILMLWHGPDVDVIGKGLSSHHWKAFSEWTRSIMEAQGALLHPGYHHATTLSEVSYPAIRDYLRLLVLDKKPKSLQK